MPLGRVILLATLWAGLASCSADEGPVAGNEPITTEAIAAVMTEHVDLQPVEIHPYPALSNRTKAPFAPWPESAEGSPSRSQGSTASVKGTSSLAAP